MTTLSRTGGSALGRRHFVRGALGVGAAALASTAGGALTGAAGASERGSGSTDPAARDVILIGANPGIQLFDGDTCTAYASSWRVDWSPYGAGTAIILWHDGRVHLFGSDPRLARWLERDFTRHFPEVQGLPWPEPVMHRATAHVDIDMARGMRARARGLTLELWDVRDRRSFATDEFPLGGVDHSLHLVLGPCFGVDARLNGRRLPGTLSTSGTPDRPSSSGFITEAEVWRG